MNICILTYIEKLSRCFQSFTQRNSYWIPQTKSNAGLDVDGNPIPVVTVNILLYSIALYCIVTLYMFTQDNSTIFLEISKKKGFECFKASRMIAPFSDMEGCLVEKNCPGIFVNR